MIHLTGVLAAAENIQAFCRERNWPFSAEDLVVHKTFAGRDLDWGDVQRVLTRQHGKLNLDQVRSELKPLLKLKGETDSIDKLERMLATVERRLRAKP